ncbi:hypothetical protein D3C72_1979590 [compost metagenome]
MRGSVPMQQFCQALQSVKMQLSHREQSFPKMFLVIPWVVEFLQNLLKQFKLKIKGKKHWQSQYYFLRQDNYSLKKSNQIQKK